MKPLRLLVPLALIAALPACSVSSLLGGGKAPATLVTLTATAPEPTQISRVAAAGQAVTIATPVVGEELSTVRVPVSVTPTDIQYVQDLQWVEPPARLFRELVAETVRRTTSRVVLDSSQSSLDPGVTVTGQLQKFGYDAQTGQVTVQYDGSMATDGGTRVETRRFTASAPADGTAATVGVALNAAANQVATQVAQWIGG